MEALITFGTPFMAVGAILSAIILLYEHLERKGLLQQFSSLKPI